jgi:hypothetical protein
MRRNHMRTLALLGMAVILLGIFLQCSPSTAPEEPIPSPSATSTPEPVPTPAPSRERPNIVVDPSCCQFDAPGDDGANKVEEYVCFRNDGSDPADMLGWTLKDEYGWTYRFPAFSLDPGASVRVRSGCGQDVTTDLYWCDEGATAIWNNDGDTVFLYDGAGALMTEFSY